VKALTWLEGVLVILLGLELSRQTAAGWTAVWISAAVLWIFLGVGLVCVVVGKLVIRKTGAGLNAPSALRPKEVPAAKVTHGS
jgi:hypothetical protein